MALGNWPMAGGVGVTSQLTFTSLVFFLKGVSEKSYTFILIGFALCMSLMTSMKEIMFSEHVPVTLLSLLVIVEGGEGWV